MGGDSVSSPSHNSDEDASSYQQFSSRYSPHLRCDMDGSTMESLRIVKSIGDNSYREDLGKQLFEESAAPLNIGIEQRMREKIYNEVMWTYDQSQARFESLKEAKSKLLSYKPGAWTGNAGGLKPSDYDVPETTSIILIGPKGSGKSSLINRISYVLEDDKFASARAQISYNSYKGEGTLFLQEYMMPRGSTAFCLYDTRSLSIRPSENIYMIRKWITKGVRHGELVVWESDSSNLKNMLKQKAQGYSCHMSAIRKVNYVIFVVNGVDVLKSMEKTGTESGTDYNQLIVGAFECSSLSFKDDKPVVVVTHGDLLSLPARTRVRVHLGELLRISPANQIFDIPDTYDSVTEFATVHMLHRCLEHADKNLNIRPLMKWRMIKKVQRAAVSICVHFSILLVALALGYMLHIFKSDDHRGEIQMDWNAIRYMWFDSD